MAIVKVHQISSQKGKAFFNIKEEYGYIGISGCIYKSPIYLIRAKEGIYFEIVQFDFEDAEEIKEYLKYYRDSYTIFRIDTDEVVEIHEENW